MAPSEADFIVFTNVVDHVAFSCLGILVSIYALYVEIKKEHNPDYVAHCDFHENASCSRVLTSEYGKGFGLLQYLVGKESMLNVRNCSVGIVFFAVQLISGMLPFDWMSHVLFYSSVGACIGCTYLAYVLFFVLKDLCVVCLVTYVANFGLLYLNHARVE